MNRRQIRTAVTFVGLTVALARCSAGPTAPVPDSPAEPRSIALAAVDCEVAADIGALIDQLEADRTLNRGRATALRAHLAAAVKHEAAGRAGHAADAYGKILTQVQQWVDAGALDAADVADLLACTEDVLDGPDEDPDPDPDPDPETAPVIDGVKSPGEWDAATAVAVWTGGTLYYTNDDENLYLALEMVDATAQDADGFRMRFDDTLDGVFTVGDNEILVRMDSYFDRHREAFGWNVDDTQKDGVRAGGANAGVNFFEVSFPLNSGDPNDFALSPGDAVGYCVQYLNNGLAVDTAAYPRVAAFDNCMLDANQANYAVLTTTP